MYHTRAIPCMLVSLLACRHVLLCVHVHLLFLGSKAQDYAKLTALQPCPPFAETCKLPCLTKRQINKWLEIMVRIHGKLCLSTCDDSMVRIHSSTVQYFPITVHNYCFAVCWTCVVPGKGLDDAGTHTATLALLWCDAKIVQKELHTMRRLRNESEINNRIQNNWLVSHIP